MDNDQSIMTTILCILDIKPILKKKIGGFWLFFLIKVFIKSKKIFKKTRWSKRKDQESKYVKSMALLPSLYLAFLKKFNKEEALSIMNEIVLKVAYTVDYESSKKHYLFTIKDPFERWLKYRSILITHGFGPHNEVEDVYISKTRMHYIVKRCIFHDFFKETGTPELTPMICDYDFIYHSALFKEFYFDRNGSNKNTLGYGADVCHYVWKDKNILTEQFKEYLKNKSNKNKNKNEKRQFQRRQYDRRQDDRRQFDRRNFNRRGSDK